MDWKVFWAAFVTVFLAELGDKTQLSVMSFSASGSSKMTVFAASSVALILATLVGVLAGDWLTKFVDPRTLKIGAGVLFIVIGIVTIIKSA